jgi:uncharacterized membrane protein YdfJ with MMPL/SSD domain
MDDLMHRVGRAAAYHPWRVVVVWVLVAVALLAAVQLFGKQTDNDLSLPGTDSQAATDVLAARFPPQQNGTSPIVFYTASGTLTDAEHKPAIKQAIEGLRRNPDVYSVISPVSDKGASAGLLSKDEATGYAPVLLDVDSGSVDVVLAQEILDAARAPAERAGIEVEAGGSIGSRLSEPETESSEVVGLVAAMVILTLVLGSLVAMGLPILVAVFALSTTLSVVGLLGHVYGIPSIAPTIATMIGLGVGIDYALFTVTRHKDQLSQGMAVKESVVEAVATSGSAIVFAGTTVVIALAALVLADIPLVTAIGMAAAVAVVLAVLGAVTLLPATLSLVGNGIQRLALPRAMQRRFADGSQTFWNGWARAVTGHPWWSLTAAVALLVPLIIPVFTLELGQEDISVAPTSTTERRAYDLVTAGLGVGYNGPLLIATVLDPVAAPSTSFTTKYRKAKSLQRQLTREQRQLTQQGTELERQKAELERQQQQLQTESQSLEVQQSALLASQRALEQREAKLLRERADLEQQQRQLQRQEAQLKSEAAALAVQARRTAAALVVVRAREVLLEQRLADATDPQVIARIERRLARVESRQVRLLDRADHLEAEAKDFAQQGRRLRTEAQELQRRGDALQRQAGRLQTQADQLTAAGTALQNQADALQRSAAGLQRQGERLQRQADRLEAQKARAERQKQRAEKLQRQLTDELTAAGGDKRATDPRIVDLQNSLLSTPGVVTLTPPQVSDDGDAMVVNAIPSTAPASDQTAALVADLRADVLPPQEVEGLQSHVGGYTASYVDLASKIASRLMIVVATVLALSFVLLLAAFRSWLLPLQAAVMNLLSVAASFGVLTVVFQWGWGLSLVGLDAPSGSVPIASYVPLMMFAILFGLSMDYEVFLGSHIVAHRELGLSARQAVTAGVGSSARVISTAALIMICVFGSFILNGDPTVKQFGVGLSVAVFLAAVLVLTLAPAMLWLFGERTWRLPSWLDRIIPSIGLKESIDEGEAGASA